jgi:hypothetical protein
MKVKQIVSGKEYLARGDKRSSKTLQSKSHTCRRGKMEGRINHNIYLNRGHHTLLAKAKLKLQFFPIIL